MLLEVRIMVSLEGSEKRHERGLWNTSLPGLDLGTYYMGGSFESIH